VCACVCACACVVVVCLTSLSVHAPLSCCIHVYNSFEKIRIFVRLEPSACRDVEIRNADWLTPAIIVFSYVRIHIPLLVVQPRRPGSPSTLRVSVSGGSFTVTDQAICGDMSARSRVI